MFGKLRLIFIMVTLTLCSAYLLVSCSKDYPQGKIIATVEDRVDGNNISSKLVLLDLNDADTGIESLTEGFYAAKSAHVAYDGKKIVFSGQKLKDDTYQIYEMDLADHSYKQLTHSKKDCGEPMYLPDGKILFSMTSWNTDEFKNNALFVLGQNESDLTQITFSPGRYSNPSVLHDGRVLAVKQQANDGGKRTNLVVLRPDGTKEMLFYKSENGSNLVSGGVETSDRQIFLLENNDDGSGHVFSVAYNNPLKTKKLVPVISAEELSGVSSTASGNLLVCYGPSDNVGSRLLEVGPQGEELVSKYFQDPQISIVEAEKIEVRTVPKKIPSEVNIEKETGLLMCQDVNLRAYLPDSLSSERKKAVKIEVLGLESSLGIVDVEKDGSVYLEIQADMPFQLQTLDAEGNIVNGPSSWMHLRPNERRACVGCHQGNEIVPENRQPLSVMKEPILIPQKTKLLAETN